MKEEDIRPRDVMINNQACIDADREYLLNEKSNWVATHCPACDAPNSKFFAEKNNIEYVECATCQTVYTNPRPTEELLHRFYAQSKNYEYWNKYIFPASDEARRKGIYAPRAATMLEQLKQLQVSGGTLVEIGSGFGSFLQEVKKLAFFDKLIAIEPTIDLAKTCASKGFEVINKPVELLEDENFADVLVAYEVIEHLFAPYTFLQKAHTMLRPGGVLIISCPNVKGFDIQMLGVSSDSFDHEHLNYFHPTALSLLLTRAGYIVKNIFTPGKLDASIVKNAVQDAKLDLANKKMLRDILITNFDKYGQDFQQLLVDFNMSSHMVAVAQRGSKP